MTYTRTDIDFNFRPHPVTGDLPLKYGEAAIEQALKNIVLTAFYERGFNVIFGTNTRSSLFELLTPLDVLTIKDFIKEGIKNFEPQAELYDLTVRDQQNSLYIELQYTIYNDDNVYLLPMEVSILR